TADAHRPNGNRHSPANRNPVASYNSMTVLLGHLPTEEMSCRKEQDCTHERNQNPSCVCLGNRRNVGIAMTIVVVAPPTVALIVIAVGICQRGQDQGGGY